MPESTTPGPIDFSRQATQRRHAAKPKAQRKNQPPITPLVERKLAAQSRYPIGQRFLYHGPNPVLSGRIVTVLGHESRGDIYVQRLSLKRNALCSPFTLEPAPEVTMVVVPKEAR